MAATPLLNPDRVDGAIHLLSAAAESLASAHWARTIHGRAAGTRLAVLRAAAAVLAVRGRPRPASPVTESQGHPAAGSRGRSYGPLDIWCLLPRVAPELTEWAQFFAVVLDESHSGAPMSVREADDLLRQGEEFVQIIAGLLGLPPVHVTGELTSLTVPGGDG